MSVDEYLAFERGAREKHRYVAGEVFAMAGASVRHNRLVARMIQQLGRGLGDGPCQVFASDLKVHVAALETFTYPDLTIVAHVEHYARRTDGAWTLREAGPGGTITIASVGITLDVDAIYAGAFELPA